MATMVAVSAHQIKKCNRCGRDIAFWQNRNGKWIAVNVHFHPSVGAHYRTKYGNHKNLTDFHQCEVFLKQDENYRLSRREDAANEARKDVATKWLPKVMAMAEEVRTQPPTAELELASEKLNYDMRKEMDEAVAKAQAEFDATFNLGRVSCLTK